jgi:hypothetical protein
MRIHVFVTAILIILLGILAMRYIPRLPGIEFMRGMFTLGGVLLICGFFMIRMYWHGLIGAGVVALVGAGRGLLNSKAAFDYIVGDRTRGPAPLIELGITLACAVLTLRVVKVLMAERTKKMLERGL